MDEGWEATEGSFCNTLRRKGRSQTKKRQWAQLRVKSMEMAQGAKGAMRTQVDVIPIPQEAQDGWV